MAHRTLEINVISAKGLKNVNLIDNMDVYAEVSLKGDSSKYKQMTKTPVDKECGKNPTWDFPVKFTIDESLPKNNNLILKFKIKCERSFGGKELGQVNVPVMKLLDSPGEDGSIKFVSYQVTKPSGRPEGTLNFSYKFGDKVSEPVKSEKGKGDQPVTTYPVSMAVGSISAPYGGPGPNPPPQPTGYEYPPPPVAAAYGGYPPQVPPCHGCLTPSPVYGYAPPGGYGCPPPPPVYGYAPPGGYGCPPPPPVYGYAPPGGYSCPPPPPVYDYAPPGGYGYPHHQCNSHKRRITSLNWDWGQGWMKGDRYDLCL
ncbi:protein SRC2-like [Durio zibethinus]|uniref:Protein SRC2-like n=1 Tax=Durio zibethinus TaxID=66656 RepID=A0A6P5X2P5_DURZI|nr:protein SRC2-like [Durio zibethinus]